MHPLLRILLVMITTTTTIAVSAQDLPAPLDLPVRPDFPDPLVMMDGTKVSTVEQWRSQRRPELLRLFAHYMYGFAPPAPKPDVMRFEVVSVVRDYLGGKATRKLIEIHHTPGFEPLQVLLVVPNQDKPAPVFVGGNFVGNQAIVPDADVPITPYFVTSRAPGIVNNMATEASRGVDAGNWPIAAIVARGYAVATFHNGNMDPDRHDWTDGVHPHYYNEGQTQPGEHEWGTIAAWAWGLQRVVDLLLTDPTIDGKRIIAYGHSRMGKTALYAAATDERIALAIPHQAGCGGTSPCRNTNPKAEKVERINRAFPHWFNDAFVPFGDAVERLPFDQNCLIALVAPRPILVSAAQEDQWADPPGQFEMLRHAESVYKLHGVEGLAQSAPLPDGQLMNSRMGYYVRGGNHSVLPEDWQAFMDFADKQLGR